MKAVPTMASEPPKGKITGVRIRKAANGHTMEVTRDGYSSREDQPQVYEKGNHDQMFADMKKHLGIGKTANAGSFKAAPRPAPMHPIAAKMAAGV